MDRRNFVKIGSATIIGNYFFKLNSFATGSSAEEPVSVVYELENPDSNSFKKLFQTLGGLESFIKTDLSKATVLIKPNLCLPHNSGIGTTTSPFITKLLCDFLISSGIKKIIIADHTLQKPDDFKEMEFIQILNKIPEVTINLINEARWYQPVQVQGKVLTNIDVLKILTRSDLFINLATAKHHSATNVSLAVKNLMGLIWNRMDFHTKFDLNQAIGDLATIIKPHLNIIDATRVLLGGGPAGPGPLIQENKLFASRDIVAVDSIVASRYNFGGKSLNPSEIKHLKAAYNNGAGEIDINKIRIEKNI
jgi:uncharacterized protein (DUF362 family)